MCDHQRLRWIYIRNCKLSYIWLICMEIKKLCWNLVIYCVDYFFISWFCFSLKERTFSPKSCWHFEQLKKKKTTKWNVALTLFLYKKDDPFLHYPDMNEKLCGVILDVRLCVLTKLVFLLSLNILKHLNSIH